MPKQMSDIFRNAAVQCFQFSVDLFDNAIALLNGGVGLPKCKVL